jgi:hypothetical protein
MRQLRPTIHLHVIKRLAAGHRACCSPEWLRAEHRFPNDLADWAPVRCHPSAPVSAFRGLPGSREPGQVELAAKPAGAPGMTFLDRTSIRRPGGAYKVAVSCTCLPGQRGSRQWPGSLAPVRATPATQIGARPDSAAPGCRRWRRGTLAPTSRNRSRASADLPGAGVRKSSGCGCPRTMPLRASLGWPRFVHSSATVDHPAPPHYLDAPKRSGDVERREGFK